MKIPTEESRYRDEIFLRDVFMRLWAGKWWIALSTTLLTLLVAGVAFMIQPTYRASTVLIPDGGDGAGASGLGSALGSLAGVASLVGISANSGAGKKNEALAVLKSHEFINTFVQDKGLLPALFPDDWDEGAKRWKDPGKMPTLSLAYKKFLDSVLFVSEERSTGLVTVGIDWHDRELAAKWANELVERLNADMRKRSLRQAEASIGYLKGELQVTNQISAQEAVSRLLEAQINKRMLANVTTEYAFRVADRAVAPDAKDSLRPRRALLIAVGFVLGMLIGVMGVLIVPHLTIRA